MNEQPPRGANGMGLLPGWADLEPAVPQITAPMRRYLTQISCVLRPGSVSGADLALRSFAAFLAETAPEVTSLAAVTRRHIEDYKPWLAARRGQSKPRLTTATIAHRRPGRTAASRDRSGSIRVWAQAQGIAVSARGRIPASVAEQDQAATQGS